MLCNFTKKSKTGGASHLHRTMPDECSFFCSKAGEKHCSIFIAVLWKSPQATVPLGTQDDMVPVPGNMQSALGCSPSLWCSQGKLSRRSRQSLATDVQQAPQQVLMSFIFLVSTSSTKAWESMGKEMKLTGKSSDFAGVSYSYPGLIRCLSTCKSCETCSRQRIARREKTVDQLKGCSFSFAFNVFIFLQTQSLQAYGWGLQIKMLMEITFLNSTGLWLCQERTCIILAVIC